ncbi:MAG: hypothetical protein SGPRY_012816, partial [Prymnesium sp.]
NFQEPTENLPTARTCFNQMCLPGYTTREQLASRLKATMRVRSLRAKTHRKCLIYDLPIDSVGRHFVRFRLNGCSVLSAHLFVGLRGHCALEAPLMRIPI